MDTMIEAFREISRRFKEELGVEMTAEQVRALCRKHLDSIRSAFRRAGLEPPEDGQMIDLLNEIEDIQGSPVP